MKFQLKAKKIVDVIKVIIVLAPLVVAFPVSSAALAEDSDAEQYSAEQDNSDDQYDDRGSVWDSYPIEMNAVNVQILDKISGKVFRQNVKLRRPVCFGSLELILKRCFINAPEDNREVYAYIEVFEHQKKIFSGWKFASYPSINLLEHPVYDIMLEF